MPIATTDSGDGLEKLLGSSPRLARAAGALAVYEGGRRLFHSTSSWWREHAAYQVRVADSDPLYDSVLDWLVAELPSSSNQRRLSVMTRGAGASYDHAEPTPAKYASDERRDPPKLRVVHTDNQSLRIRVSGHQVRVRLALEDGGSSSSQAGDRGRSRISRHVEFECRTRAAQRAVMAHLERIHSQRQRRDPALWMASPWGGWDRRNDLPHRSLESVVIPPDQLESIVTDLSGFLAAEHRYNELAIPWHRGYLFHGPPGTGKTSLAKALAHRFGLDLWYASLPDLREGSDLIHLINGVQPRSLLLLEDVDVAIGTHTRPDHDTDPAAGGGQAVSLAALLNALDGVATPHGLVTVMTTNHLDRLDPALVRAGRMDRVELIDLPGPDEIDTLYRRFYGQPLLRPEVLPLRGLTQAQVSEVFKRHLDDPTAGRDALLRAAHHHAQEATR